MYFESNLTGKRQDVPKIVKVGEPIQIELTSGERVTVSSTASDCTGEIAVESMGQALAVQRVIVPGNGVKTLAVPGYNSSTDPRVVVKVSATAGYVQVSVS
ncbi:hypothetical protein [Bradyrhizobium cosmicum]|uniref:hypothetical protein n=1 Tax=Bradyrhizobium cosmicum TaxID=1404864 RepID=UPI0028EB3149|nr:hypothetical protein [Bradyrhizobium cosmicum]